MTPWLLVFALAHPVSTKSGGPEYHAVVVDNNKPVAKKQVRTVARM